MHTVFLEAGRFCDYFIKTREKQMWHGRHNNVTQEVQSLKGAI